MLNHNAKYTINMKALEKWSNERLIMNKLENDMVEGIFRYEGTTCSNLGHKLEFIYTVKIEPSIGYRIISLNCTPADEGYKYMCSYLRAPELLFGAITGEKPLLHKNLEDVLTWKRQFSPEGCCCNPESRSHKWGIVLEVLHYALVKQEKENLASANKYSTSPEN